jgi:GDPmannose 4,6-dehydratase
MWLMMQHENPEDWVLATGVTKTVREFAIEAFNHVNLHWEDFVFTSEKYLRPNEVDYLLGDSSKARKELKWKPSVDFSGLVKIMVEHDIKEAKKDLALLKDNLISPTWEYPKI